EASARRLLPLDAIRSQLPADAALVLWMDADPLGERWACVLRRQGPPSWQRLTGSGPGGAWTERDRTLSDRLYRALTDPHSTRVRARALASRKERLAPLQALPGARGDLPPARRLFVVPTGELAFVPVEALGAGYSVSYVPSGSVLARTARRHRRLRGAPLLA